MIKFLNILTIMLGLLFVIAVICFVLWLGFELLSWSLIIVPLGFLWKLAVDMNRDIGLKDTLIISELFKKEKKRNFGIFGRAIIATMILLILRLLLQKPKRMHNTHIQVIIFGKKMTGNTIHP